MNIKHCPLCKGDLIKRKTLAQGIVECKEYTARFYILITSLTR